MQDAALKRLLDIRERKEITIKPSNHLRKTVKLLDGKERPLQLRYYQIQMILHLLSVNRFIVGDDTGLGKTLESIASLCYLWDRNPATKVLVLTRKSAVRQWAEEFTKFTEGVQVITCKGTPKQREQARAAFDASTGPTVLLMGHRSAVQDFRHLQDRKWDVFILDEAVIAKTPNTQAHQVCCHLSYNSERSWGLTATLIKNNLVEGYGILRTIAPEIFPQSLASFIDEYCVTQLTTVGRGKKIKRIIGYRKSLVAQFRERILPNYLGRPKHEVATELPPLVTRKIMVGMSPVQESKYKEALTGLLELGTGEEKEVTKLTEVTYCQEIVNHPSLIGVEGESEKLDELVDLLTEGDLAGEKVIIFTRFEKMVTLGVAALEKAGVKCMRITGAENEDQRKLSQDTFQDINSDINVVWITTAGSDAINLQMAKAIVFYDTPFSAGDYIQILGRMLRIGSIHDRVFAVHLVCEKTIDERVIEIMESKMVLVEAVLGKRIKGEKDTDDDMIKADQGSILQLFESLREDAKGLLRD
jgi:SNF2 family DNA or RNA helicase